MATEPGGYLWGYPPVDRAFQTAVENGNIPEALNALNQGADINLRDADTNFALGTAMANGDEQMVKFLLDQGAKPGPLDMEAIELYPKPESSQIFQEASKTGLTPEQQILIQNRAIIRANNARMSTGRQPRGQAPTGMSGLPPISQGTMERPPSPSTVRPPSPSTVRPPSPSTVRPPSPRPTMGQSTMGQSTMGQPTMGQPTMGQPTMGQPTMGQPTMGQPTMGQPTMGQPTMYGMMTQPTMYGMMGSNPIVEVIASQNQAELNRLAAMGALNRPDIRELLHQGAMSMLSRPSTNPENTYLWLKWIISQGA